MKKSLIELLPALFNIFTAQYGTGERKDKNFGSARNKYIVVPINTILNGGDKYKTGALCLHLEEYTCSLVICSKEPFEGKPIEDVLTTISIGRAPGSKKTFFISLNRTEKIENPEDPHFLKLLEIRGEIFAQMNKLRKSDEYEKAEEFATNEKTLHYKV